MKNIVTKYKFNYDYSKTLWMKMFLARPDFKNNKSEVLITFEQALDIIRTVDDLTQGIKKIVYLVGWQGLGHDDCYPEMHKVNDFLKRDCDATGRESLLWLCEEAKRYHTVVSFHGNLADEYSVNESHAAIVKANAVVNGMDGKPAVIEVFNERNAYKISYKQYYESGIFKELWDKFMEAVPVKEAGTVHLDNFCIAESLNPETFLEEQVEARNKMIDYITGVCGIDVTTEYTYREAHFRAESPGHPIRKALYTQYQQELPECDFSEVPIHTLGRIPASWWTSGMTAQDCMDIPVSVYSGHLTDDALRNVFYGMMHGEDIWIENGVDAKAWVTPFMEEFCNLQLPYFYLNRYDRLAIENNGTEDDPCYRVTFSQNVVSDGKDMSISKNGKILKKGNDILLPLTEDNRIFIAYSENGKSGVWNIPDAENGTARVYEITAEGNKYLSDAGIKNGSIVLDVKAKQALAVYC